MRNQGNRYKTRNPGYQDLIFKKYFVNYLKFLVFCYLLLVLILLFSTLGAELSIYSYKAALEQAASEKIFLTQKFAESYTTNMPAKFFVHLIYTN